MERTVRIERRMGQGAFRLMSGGMSEGDVSRFVQYVTVGQWLVVGRSQLSHAYRVSELWDFNLIISKEWSAYYNRVHGMPLVLGFKIRHLLSS